MDYGNADVLEGFAEFIADDLRRSGEAVVTFKDTDLAVSEETKLRFGQRAASRAGHILGRPVRVIVQEGTVRVTAVDQAE
ncbi:hypothetical protein ACRYCC_37810 [Actinomadura scrupuli]|uniref:hypothetical protein n=1 Tax=Actinomadura scrupuli TaxID=559629 RepID=UPI003D987C69